MNTEYQFVSTIYGIPQHGHLSCLHQASLTELNTTTKSVEEFVVDCGRAESTGVTPGLASSPWFGLGNREPQKNH